MINKEKVKNTIIKVAVPLLILSTSIGSYAWTQSNLLPNSQTSTIERPQTVIENTIDIAQIRTIEGLKGISNFFYYNGENTIAVGMNEKRSELLKSIPEDGDLTEYYRKVYGGIYNVDLGTMKIEQVDHLQSLDADFGSGYSPNGKYIDYVEEGRSYIYHQETGKKQVYSEDEIYGNWTESGNALIKYGKIQDDEESFMKFQVFSPEGKLVREMSLSDDVDWVDISTKFYSPDGKDIYFAGRIKDGTTLNTGLYKIDMANGEIVDIMSMLHVKKETIKNPGTDMKEHPGEFLDVYKQSRIYNYSILSNGLIVMNAMVDHVQGLYVYNTHSKELKMLLDSDGGISFVVAPDESKIVYAVSKPITDNREEVKEKKDDSTNKDEVKPFPNDDNIYVANIDEDKLSNITYIKKDTFGTDFKWSNDSKKLLFFEPEEATIEMVTLK